MENIDNKSKTKVFVALSGGVDSAVSAALLKKEGYDVTGVYMKNWSGDDFGIQADCPWEEDQVDAENVCKHLDIPFRSFNFEKEYRNKVVEYFFEEYEKGRTPNPDVMCNKEIKFKLFLERALEEGADLIATGHYARRAENPNGSYSLYTGIDETKNQVYFLYNNTQQQLAKTIFPVGNYTKKKVRELASEFGLPNKDKPDSQGICFIGEIDVLKFLMSRIPEQTGEIRNIDTDKKIGEHKGIYFYTIGQRKGLGIGGQKENPGDTDPFFVCDKNAKENILYVCQGEENSALYKKEVEIENIHLIENENNSIGETNLAKLQNKPFQAMIRYRQKPQDCTVRISDNKITVEFEKPQRAVSSGQSLVLFDGEECLGGGVIR